MKRAVLFLLLLGLAGCGESMDRQNRLKTYGAAGIEGWPAAGEALPLVPGTVSRDALARDRAIADPPSVSLALLERGRERYDIYCAPCHGLGGAGDGIIVARGFPRPISTELEFTSTRTGTYHLFCAEYCGAQHSRMTGNIVVMTQPAYVQWLRQKPHGDSLVREGEALYAKFGCGACHAPESQVAAPKLYGIAGRTVRLQTGANVVANDAYIRRSILEPRADIVAGYAPIMPSYAAVPDASQVDALVAYIKSIPKEVQP